ncbi:MAG: hypothetical protein Q9186_003033 [Xanthomendoza sp. 1 TL-2023]
MDPHTARCLQLSTSICMPFNPYRPHRLPDHFNRPRGPPQMPQQQARVQPARLFPYNVSTPAMSYKPVYPPSHPSMATPIENIYATPPLITTCTPDSFNMGSTYIQSSISPEADPSDIWGSSFDFGNINDQKLASQDFGLGLGALGSDMNSSNFDKMGEVNQFPYPSLVNDVETLAFDPGSPDGQSWSSLSEASAGLASDMADCSPTSHGTSGDLEYPADLDAFLRSAESTPSAPHYGFTQTSSHCRAESAPRHSFRTSPYPTNLGRGRSFSTGTVSLSRTQRASTYIQTVQQTSDVSSQHSSLPLTATQNMDTFAANDFQMYCQPSQGPTPDAHFVAPSNDLSSFGASMFGESAQTSPLAATVLQSTGSEKHLCGHHFAGATSPPDLFGPLNEEASSPPAEDFDCDEADMPRAQDLRFEGDMYTPRYVRGHGNKREGWCGTCKPGRWLVLKNSAYWYDKSFSHGISAATGAPFEGPKETRRMKGNPDVWEGLCGSCNDWIALISSKKKGTTWFRHAYKCHTHQKVKDTTKRRREVTQPRVTKAPKCKAVKSESREQSPFSMESSLAPLDEADETDSLGHGSYSFIGTT